MTRVGMFHKVSYEQFKKDWIDTFKNKYNEMDDEYIDITIKDIYDSIKLPKRATTGSAGYDFFCPISYTIPINGSVKIPTGIKCEMDRDWVFQIYPRSSHGFKYGMHLANTVGIIDSDYIHSDNEGHIFVKLINDSDIASPINLKKGDAFCQGIFTPYGITLDDDVSEIRHGGLGSTSR